MWGLVLSAITIGVSMIFGVKEEHGNSSSTSNNNIAAMNIRNLPIFRELVHSDNQHFISGTVLGIGLSLLYSSIIYEFRIIERCRLLWRFFWNTNEQIILFPFRTPGNIINSTYMAELVQNAVEFKDDGSIKILVSPQTVASTTLNISVVTIEPGRELPSTRTNSVEFYYVLSCSTNGTNFSQQGVIESSSLQQGDFFVIDYNNMRWISNHAGSIPLVLLRVTDGGVQTTMKCTKEEQIRLDQNIKKQLSVKGLLSSSTSISSRMTRISTMDKLYDSWKQVQTIAMKYVTSATGQLSDTRSTTY